MKDVMDILYFIFGASLVVLIVMNAAGFAQAVTSIGNFVTGESTILTGANYGGAGGGRGGAARGHRAGG